MSQGRFVFRFLICSDFFNSQTPDHRHPAPRSFSFCFAFFVFVLKQVLGPKRVLKQNACFCQPWFWDQSGVLGVRSTSCWMATNSSSVLGWGAPHALRTKHVTGSSLMQDMITDQLASFYTRRAPKLNTGSTKMVSRTAASHPYQYIYIYIFIHTYIHMDMPNTS